MLKVPMITYSDNDEERQVEVELSEFLKEAYVEYNYDWGNGHAIIISFENQVPNEETLIKAIKEQLNID